MILLFSAITYSSTSASSVPLSCALQCNHVFTKGILEHLIRFAPRVVKQAEFSGSECAAEGEWQCNRRLGSKPAYRPRRDTLSEVYSRNRNLGNSSFIIRQYFQPKIGIQPPQRNFKKHGSRCSEERVIYQPPNTTEQQPHGQAMICVTAVASQFFIVQSFCLEIQLRILGGFGIRCRQ